MKRVSLSILLFFPLVLLQAQSGSDRIVPKISALSPALGVEIPLSEVTSVQVQATVGLRPEVVSTPSNIQTQIILIPQLSIQPRYYFDLIARRASGADVTDFSADFFTLDINLGRAITQTGNFNRLELIPAIGLQRSFARRGYVSIHAGPSVTLGNRLLVQGNWLSVSGQLNIGWRLGRV